MITLNMHIPSAPAHSYPVMIGADLLNQPEKWLPSALPSKKIIIITDDSTHTLYGKKLAEQLTHLHPILLHFPAGEMSKNYHHKQKLEEIMFAEQCGRDTIIFALGGGVVGDLSGFIAATYMRGIPFIQIPTTLLAMVDSSIGGKTGINTAYGKNLIGAFWQPLAVIIDINTLTTLPQEHLINGLIEAIKMALTCDAEHFAYLQKNISAILERDPAILQSVIEHAIHTKMNIVSLDEKENNLRMILNFGHTIGHAIEKISDYKILHGYAVAYGILVEAKLAELMGLLSPSDYSTIQHLLAQCGITGNALKNMQIDDIIAATKNDKKAKQGDIRYILLSKIGQVFSKESIIAHPTTDEMVEKAMRAVIE